jgi:hypothetical protein
VTGDPNARFWDLAAPLLAAGEADEGTIMGGRCLRIRGQFLAMPHHQAEGLVVKLPARRVAELVASGTGRPFTPNGRVFREWVHIPAYDASLWASLLAEARAFVSR